MGFCYKIYFPIIGRLGFMTDNYTMKLLLEKKSVNTRLESPIYQNKEFSGERVKSFAGVTEAAY